MTKIDKIGLGGGCHWCTEAVFKNLCGVINVEQGYIASSGINNSFSEAVIVHYNPKIITLQLLLEIHLRTHAAASAHSMRTKYRSAAYYFAEKTKTKLDELLQAEQVFFSNQLITQILAFKNFKASRESIQQYYEKHPEAPFCERYIKPKLQWMQENINEEYLMNK